MSSRVNVCIHHHGEFVTRTEQNYIGGTVDIVNMDWDKFSFRDLEDFAEKFKYDYNSVVYFCCNGKNQTYGFKILYDDDSVRELINLCMPYGCIDLYVDHVGQTPLCDYPQILNQNQNEPIKVKSVVDNELEDNSSEDPDYDYSADSETESEMESDNGNIDESDDELLKCRVDFKKYKEGLSVINVDEGMKEIIMSSDESEFDSGDLRSVDTSSEDEICKKGYVGSNLANKRAKKKEKVYNANSSNDENIKLASGMKFLCMDEFRAAVRDYGIKERRALNFIKNDSQRCQVVCEMECPFYIWCSKLKNTEVVQIKTFIDEHLCTKPYSNRIASTKYLTNVYGDRIRKNPQWRVKEMIEVIKQDLEIEVPRIKCVRIRKAALEGVRESLIEHYGRVYDFGYEILLSNSKNTVNIRTTMLNEGDENKFKRIYICYHALKEGWKLGCRPVLGLDGCFLKTVCGGQLLSAVGRDGNNQMFPVAFAVVESENTESWRWFIELLSSDLNLQNGHGITIISDQQKGLENALKELVPQAEHRFCARHLYSNFRKRFPSQLLRRAFWQASCATHPAAHQKVMKDIEKLSKAAHDALKRLNPKVWTKAFFNTTSEADNVENNMSECFNAWIINERYMPLLTMLQEIHFKLMNRMRQKREDMMKSGLFVCPRIKKKLDKAVTESRSWTASWNGEKIYAVKQGVRSMTVDLDQRTCSCRNFQLTGVPCQHAIAAIHDSRQQPVTFLSEYYKRDRYMLAYSQSLQPLNGEEFWEIQNTPRLLPPDVPKKLRGRPKRLRRREEWEGGSRSRRTQVEIKIPGKPTVQIFQSARVMHCNVCKKTGHRKNKCPDKNEEHVAASVDIHIDEEQVEGNKVTKKQDLEEKKSAKEGWMHVKCRGRPRIIRKKIAQELCKIECSVDPPMMKQKLPVKRAQQGNRFQEPTVAIITTQQSTSAEGKGKEKA